MTSSPGMGGLRRSGSAGQDKHGTGNRGEWRCIGIYIRKRDQDAVGQDEEGMKSRDTERGGLYKDIGIQRFSPMTVHRKLSEPTDWSTAKGERRTRNIPLTFIHWRRYVIVNRLKSTGTNDELQYAEMLSATVTYNTRFAIFHGGNIMCLIPHIPACCDSGRRRHNIPSSNYT